MNIRITLISLMCVMLTCLLRSEHGLYIGQEVEPVAGSGGSLHPRQGEVKYHMELLAR